MPRYYDMDKLKQMIEARIKGKRAFLRVAKWLDSLPAADVVPAAIGEWLENEAGCKCSHCGWQGYGEHDSECMPQFCPGCFARMYSKFDGDEYAKVESFRHEKEARLVREIFAEIQKSIVRRMKPDVALIDDRLITDIAELEKKYVGEQKPADCELTDTEIIRCVEAYADRECQRPLRAATPQGERISLAISEEIPAGASCTFFITLLSDDHEAAVREWLDYGVYSGIGQWRNSGKGRFVWEELTD